jgi:hypothetical protein
MKKMFFVLLSIYIALPVFAGFVITPFGGYTTVNAGKINDDLTDFYNTQVNTGAQGKNLIKSNSGYYTGLDLGYSFLPGLSAGVRLEYVGMLDSYTQGYAYDEPTYEYIGLRYQGSIVPVMAGVSYLFNIPNIPLSVGADAYAGYGFARLMKEETSTFALPDDYDYAQFSNGVFVADLAGKIGYTIAPGFILNASVGYRLANVPKFKSDKDSTVMGYAKGNVLKDSSGKDLGLDMSGLTAGGSLNIAFDSIKPQGFFLEPFAGYTRVSMGQVNHALEGFKSFLETISIPTGPNGIKVTPHNNAVNAGLDAGFSVAPGLSLAARVEYIGSTGKVYFDSREIATLDNIDFRWDASIVPVMLGLSYDYSLGNSGFTVGAGAFGGYGFASSSFVINENPVFVSHTDYSGGAITSDFIAKLGYKLNPVTLNIQLGYRSALVPRMTSPDTALSILGTVPGGDPAKDNQGRDLAYDFSGLIANIGVAVAF